MKKQEHNSTDKRTRTEAVGSYLWIAGTRTLGIWWEVQTTPVLVQDRYRIVRRLLF